MRRISLAVALAGAVAAAGCGGGGSGSDNGTNPGVKEGTFKVTVQNTPPLAITGGKVTSTPPGIDCGVGGSVCEFSFANDLTVTLNAVPVDPNILLGWAGDCSGEGACTLSGKADKYIVVQFGTERTGHPNFSAASVHGPAYLAFVSGTAGALDCASCHGANLQGQGIALSCSTCHTWPLGDHFKVTAAFDDHGSGWGQSCQRCHTDQGFRDYIGELAAPTENGTATDNHLDGTFNSTNALTTCTVATIAAGTCDPNAYAFGPFKCTTCHNAKAAALTSVMFNNMTTASTPASVTVDSSTAICAQCHQGRESTRTVNARIGATADDAVIGTQTFMNPHYLGAAATLFGTAAKGWAEYPGKVYTGRNMHGGKGACTDCHDAHTGHLPADGAEMQSKCGACHFDETTGNPVATFMELEESRQFGFEGDIDGDTIIEPLKAEIEGLEDLVYEAIKVYSLNVVGTAACYSDGHPYFFKDNGNVASPSVEAGIPGDGTCQADEMAGSTQRYNQFTPRLLRAGFNFKWAHAEPGAWAHNPRYAIEILYDAIFDLNAGIRADTTTAPFGTAIVTTNVRGSFNGHFGSAQYAPEPYAQFLYHPAAGSFYGTRGPGFTSATAATCYQCHGGQGGIAAYLGRAGQAAPADNSITIANKVTGLQCGTCHVDGANMKGLRSDIGTLYVPPQKDASVPANGVVSFTAANLPPGFNVCATCHTGLENKASVDAKIAAATEPQAIGFVNGHYFGAAGIMFGTNAKVLFEYPSKTYTGSPAFWSTGQNGPHGSPHGASCARCHDAKGSKHTFEIDLATTVSPGTWGGAYPVAGMQPGAQNTAACNGCHAGPYALLPKEEEFEVAKTELLAAIQAYAWGRKDAVKNDGTTLANPHFYSAVGAGVCYDGHTYPYFIRHDAATGDCTAQEITNAGPYQVRTQGAYVFDAELLKAAYNYQWMMKDPGAWAHNEYYVLQAIYDSIVALGGTPTFTVVAATDAEHAPVCSPLNRPATMACP